MKKRIILICSLLAIGIIGNVQAGNPDRVGQSGASQFLNSPWAGSTGMAGSWVAGVQGVESFGLNPAGLSGVSSTDFAFTNSSLFGGKLDVKQNSFGMGQRIGKKDVLGVYFSSYDLGNTNITTEESPDNTLGTYTMSYLNLGVGYAHQFSKAISAGVAIKAVSEGTAVVSATGVALDAGIQYKTGDSDRVKIGLSLRNVGTSYGFSGSGLSNKAIPDGTDNSMTIESRVQNFELPTVLQMGLSYDFHFDSTKVNNVLTVSGSYSSNAFDKDQGRFGLQYALKRMIYLRAGYTLETNITSKDKSTKIYSGPTGGVSLVFPFGKDKDKLFAVDYSYQYSVIFTGTHVFGIRLNL